MKKARVISSVILLLFSIFFLFECKKLSHSGGLSAGLTLGPDFLPYALGILMLFLSILLFIQSIILGKEKKNKRFFPKWEGLKRIFCILGGLLGYVLFFERLGFILSTFLCLLLIMILLKRRRFLTIIIVSLTVTFGLYGLFITLLGISFPRGVLNF